MAHFKRRKCRYNAVHAKRGSLSSWRAKHGYKPVRTGDVHTMSWEDWRQRWIHPKGKSYLSMMNGNPAWWDRVFHVRPHRVRTKRMERAVLLGKVDPDDLAWPIPYRPWQYWW